MLKCIASRRKRLDGRLRLRHSGFTLIELVTVTLIVGILAVTVVPSLVNRQTYDERGFYDQTLAILRYAQKTAIAQRRNVCVAFTSTTVTLTVASASGSSATCNTNVAGLDGAAQYTITAKTDAKFTDTGGTAITPTAFTFNALGQASVSQTFRIYGLSKNITIDKETGYVYAS